MARYAATSVQLEPPAQLAPSSSHPQATSSASRTRAAAPSAARRASDPVAAGHFTAPSAGRARSVRSASPLQSLRAPEAARSPGVGSSASSTRAGAAHGGHTHLPYTRRAASLDTGPPQRWQCHSSGMLAPLYSDTPDSAARAARCFFNVSWNFFSRIHSTCASAKTTLRPSPPWFSADLS